MEKQKQINLTTIQASDKLWQKLNKNKGRGESFEDVIWRYINFMDNEIKLKKKEGKKNEN